MNENNENNENNEITPKKTLRLLNKAFIIILNQNNYHYIDLDTKKSLYDGFYAGFNLLMKLSDLPDNINDVTDSILDEVVECEHNGKDCNQQCTTAFRILPNELALYPSCHPPERLNTSKSLVPETTPLPVLPRFLSGLCLPRPASGLRPE